MTTLSEYQILYTKYKWEFLRRNQEYIKDWNKLQKFLEENEDKLPYIKYIQTQLGHSSPSVTLNIYAHLMKSANQKSTLKLENMVFSGSGK